MGEPNRREEHNALQRESRHAQGEPYAADVLLIAEAAGDHEHERGNGGSGTAPSEPLDMESVVRKLIALFNEQQP